MRRLEEDYYGKGARILDRIPDNEPDNWGGGILIVKGQIVTPRPIEVVTKYEI